MYDMQNDTRHRFIVAFSLCPAKLDRDPQVGGLPPFRRQSRREAEAQSKPITQSQDPPLPFQLLLVLSLPLQLCLRFLSISQRPIVIAIDFHDFQHVASLPSQHGYRRAAERRRKPVAAFAEDGTIPVVKGMTITPTNLPPRSSNSSSMRKSSPKSNTTPSSPIYLQMPMPHRLLWHQRRPRHAHKRPLLSQPWLS